MVRVELELVGRELLEARLDFVDQGPRWLITLPNLEPGPYAACPVSFEELGAYDGKAPAFPGCVSGVLTPGGRLELTLLP